MFIDDILQPCQWIQAIYHSAASVYRRYITVLPMITDVQKGNFMALPSDVSVRSSFRVKWEKFTAFKNKKENKRSWSRERNAFWLKFVSEILDPQQSKKRLVETCTYTTQRVRCSFAETSDSRHSLYLQSDSTPLFTKTCTRHEAFSPLAQTISQTDLLRYYYLQFYFNFMSKIIT